MESLKSLIPSISQAIGMTPAAIYERQRALVRAGLLHTRPGRGPGSGVPADAKAVAMLLISILATGSLSEVEEQTKAVASLKSVTGRCPVTGKRTFAAAITATLESEPLRRRALSATARRSGKAAMASITFLRVPIDEVVPVPSLHDVEKLAEDSKFGTDLHAFYLADFVHLTVEATINLWGTVRNLEFGGTS